MCESTSHIFAMQLNDRQQFLFPILIRIKVCLCVYKISLSLSFMINWFGALFFFCSYENKTEVKQLFATDECCRHINSIYQRFRIMYNTRFVVWSHNKHNLYASSAKNVTIYISLFFRCGCFFLFHSK